MSHPALRLRRAASRRAAGSVFSASYDPALHQQLRDPRIASQYWSVVDQATDEIMAYRPDTVAPSLHHAILNHFAAPPRTPTGHAKILVVLASRQTGKTTCAVLAAANHIKHNPGTFGTIMADTRDRAETVMRTVVMSEANEPDSLRVPTIPSPELKNRTYYHGGKLQSGTVGSANAGIGKGQAVMVWTEVPFCEGAEDNWNKTAPAFINRQNALAAMESTPSEMSEPSAEWYQEICAMASRNLAPSPDTGSALAGRWTFCFAPMYSSLLNERPWYPEWVLSNEEVSLLNAYGPGGTYHQGAWSGAPEDSPLDPRYLTLQNLAFLRELADVDGKVRRHPELARVFYPLDPVSCWLTTASGSIPAHAIAALEARSGIMVPTSGPPGVRVFKAPEAGVNYLICVDPAGYGGGDQAAWHILALVTGAVEQVATFSSNSHDPHQVADLIVEYAAKYNHAYVVVENTGVGAATLVLLETAQRAGRLRYLHQEKIGLSVRPGVSASGQRPAEAHAALVDLMLDSLIIRDLDLLQQLKTYKQDKSVQPSATQQILRPGEPGFRRRAKHHWDKVSALGWGAYVISRGQVRLFSRPTSRAHTSREEFARRTAEIAKAVKSREREWQKQVTGGRRGSHGR